MPRSASRDDLLDFADPQRRPRRPARHRVRLVDASPNTSRATTAPRRSTSPTSSATRRSGSRAIGWDEIEADERTARRPARRGCARRWRTGRSGCRRASTTRRAPTPRPRSSPSSPRRREARRLLPQPRPLPARRPLPRPVPRGDRDRAARRVARPHHALLPPRDVPRPARADARARGRRARRGPRRHLRPVPVRVGEHAAADHAADVGPGGRRRAPEGAAGRSAERGRGSATRCARAAGCSPATGVGRASRLGAFTRPEHLALGGPDARRRHATTPGMTPSTRSATCCSPRTCGSTR